VLRFIITGSICRTPYGIDAHHTHCFIKKTYTAHGWFIERGATNESVCMTNAGLSTINNPACQMLTTPPRTVCYDCCQQMNCDRDSLYCNNYDHIDTKYMPSFMKTGTYLTLDIGKGGGGGWGNQSMRTNIFQSIIK
jgi:hypothetical protein